MTAQIDKEKLIDFLQEEINALQRMRLKNNERGYDSLAADIFQRISIIGHYLSKIKQGDFDVKAD